ncbi:MAG: hypothetical protein BMS9Abin23_0167 [Thermodesulfobacteriota bacterium]|nr:MAG: hypothetical protein BMS9Abin23_0167 [Thermodesulfobacteriota bacterium]
MDKGSADKGGQRKKKTKMLSCYKCGKPVTGMEEECPHCGAKAPRINPAVILRIAFGVMLAVILWLLFFRK